MSFDGACVSQFRLAIVGVAEISFLSVKFGRRRCLSPPSEEPALSFSYHLRSDIESATVVQQTPGVAVDFLQRWGNPMHEL